MFEMQRVFEESSLEPCDACEGPFDYWGKSSGYRLFRCRVCGVVHFLERGAPIPPRGRTSRSLSGPQTMPFDLWTDPNNFTA